MNDNTNELNCNDGLKVDFNNYKNDILEVLNTLDVVKFLLKDPNDLSSDYSLILGLKTIVDNLYSRNNLTTSYDIKNDI